MSARVAREFGGIPKPQQNLHHKEPLDKPIHLKRQQVNEDDLLYSLKDMFRGDFKTYPTEKEIERPNRYDLSEGANEELDKYMAEQFEKLESKKHLNKKNRPMNDPKQKKQQHWNDKPLKDEYKENVLKKFGTGTKGPSQVPDSEKKAKKDKKGKKEKKQLKKEKPQQKHFGRSRLTTSFDDEVELESPMELTIYSWGTYESPEIYDLWDEEDLLSDEGSIEIIEFGQIELIDSEDDYIDSEEEDLKKKDKKEKKDKKDKKDKKKEKKDKEKKKEKKDKKKEKKDKDKKKEKKDKKDHSPEIEQEVIIPLKRKDTDNLNQEFKADTSDVPTFSWTYVDGKLYSHNA